MAGKDFNDRVLAAEVRTLALYEIKKILKNPKSKYYGPILVKLAGGVLPRLNEHSGQDGEPIQIEMVNYADTIQFSPTE